MDGSRFTMDRTEERRTFSVVVPLVAILRGYLLVTGESILVSTSWHATTRLPSLR